MADQDKGRWLNLIDPFSFEPTGLRFKIVGPDSDTRRKADLAAADELADLASADGTISAEDRETVAVNLLARLVVDWQIEQDGQALSCNHKNITRLLKSVRWIRAAVDTFAADRHNFKPEDSR
ncbi:hypothetical protein [uncultured Pleomorphomonas sp.]|uniref:hypothetical protein n=1 Tax=uncultured Pleomorphomonas sp. TaxID=442121 RepID=UPI0025892212|nr:hypothetical protein [uncultured Pleomorphomonas sp.]